MRATIIEAPHKMTVGSWDTPTPAEGEVLIKVKAAGVCAGDLYFYTGKNPYARYPQVCGHEIAGEVADLGKGVKGFKPGDRVVVKAGQVVPGDREIIQGIASIDESAITGESAAVIREAGGDRSGVTGGTLVVSDQIIIRITSGAGESFLDRMIVLVEGAIRQRTPNEIALTLKRELTVSRKPLFNRSRRVQTSRAPSSICGARNMRMQLPFVLSQN